MFVFQRKRDVRHGQVPPLRHGPALTLRHLLRGVPHTVHGRLLGPCRDLHRLYEAQDGPGAGGVPHETSLHQGLRDQEQGGPQVHREGRQVPRGGKQTISGFREFF